MLAIKISSLSLAVKLAVAAALSVPLLAGAADKDIAEDRFAVYEYRVLGNTVLDTREIETLLYERLGPNKSIDDVQQARAALEAHYHERGYGTVFVDVPEQTVNGGLVRLQVTEGKVARTRITGTQYFSNREIRNALPEARPGTVPHLPTLQAEVSRLNTETGDRMVTPVLKAGASPGTVDLSLQVSDNLPVHVSSEINNQYSKDTSKLRANVAVSYDNFFGRLDSLSIQHQASPEDLDEVNVWAASYSLRLTDAGTKLALFYVSSDSDIATVGDGGSTVNVLGKGKIYGLRWVAPVVSTATASHAFVGGIEYKDYLESLIADDLLATPISYLNFSLGNASAWRAPRQVWALQSSASFGTRGVANDTEEFRIKRFRGVANYFILRADGSYSQQFSPWDLNFRWRLGGQYAVDSIISNEQFSIAGADGVRGYLESEQLADAGIKSSIELGSPSWSLWGERLRTDAFVFFDYGRASRINPLRSQDPQTLVVGGLLEEPTVTLRSAGFGFNIAVWQHLFGSFALAYPLTDASADDGTESGDLRIHFRLRATW